MAKGSGGQATTDPATKRGESWPCLRQFSVFIENRVGRLHDLLRYFEGHRVRIVALSIANSVDCAIVRLIVNDTDRGRELLSLNNFSFSESDLVGVELPDSHQPFVDICLALLQAEINIHYTYPLLYHKSERGAIALYVENVDMACGILRERGHLLITEGDLLQSDP